MTVAPLGSRRIRQYLVALRLALLIAATGIATSPASAHREGPAGRTDGISIPTLAHGQMRIIAGHFDDILTLADSQVFTDEPFRRIRNYISLQYATCLWGVMPASLTDEASPFNECSHGYLSAAEALLLRMKTMRGPAAAADAMSSQIDHEMQADDSAFVLCRYSDEPFNTAEIVGPHWSEVPSHMPTLITMIAAAGIICGITAAGAAGMQLGSRARENPTENSAA